MVDLLQTGTAWLGGQLKAVASRTVTYTRPQGFVTPGGNEDTIEDLPVTVGRTEFEQVDGYGVLQRTESRDYLVNAADFVLNQPQPLPQAGDRITEVVDGTTYTYEVMAPGGEPPWRYSDPQKVRLRIHTKHIDTETT
jgi:hypothetical protein